MNQINKSHQWKFYKCNDVSFLSVNSLAIKGLTCRYRFGFDCKIAFIRFKMILKTIDDLNLYPDLSLSGVTKQLR